MDIKYLQLSIAGHRNLLLCIGRDNILSQGGYIVTVQLRRRISARTQQLAYITADSIQLNFGEGPCQEYVLWTRRGGSLSSAFSVSHSQAKEIAETFGVATPQHQEAA